MPQKSSNPANSIAGCGTPGSSFAADLFLIGGVNDIAHVLNRRSGRVCDFEGEAFALHQEVFSIPFITRAGKMRRAAELNFIARYFTGLDLS